MTKLIEKARAKLEMIIALQTYSILVDKDTFLNGKNGEAVMFNMKFNISEYFQKQIQDVKKKRKIFICKLN